MGSFGTGSDGLVGVHLMEDDEEGFAPLHLDPNP